VDPDCIGRVALARALVRESWSVSVVDSEWDVTLLSRDRDELHVGLIDARHPTARDIVQLLARTHPGLTIVVRRAGAPRAAALALPVERIEYIPADASARDVICAIRRTTRL